MGNDGVIVSETEPTCLDKVTWLKILPDGSREWYERSDSGWNLVQTEANPLAGGLNLDVTQKIEITRLKIVKGLIIELEYEG